MSNERLRNALVAGCWTHGSFAQQVDVDPKSVERWVNLGRVPRRTTALRAAEILGEDVHALWPTLRQPRRGGAGSAELVALHDARADVPVSTYVELLASAQRDVSILVYAAVFLHEAYPRLNNLLQERATAGCAVRIAIGDADSANVQQRGEEEQFGHGIESRCRLALLHYQPLLGVPGIELRTHGTTLYNSIYQADDQMLVNAHVWGTNAYRAPLWHLQRTGAGGVFDTYAESFNAVWATGTPISAKG
ncbi:XRE family transcriptional regulator [Streptomyces sp. 796.1]|uniref:XRE family transcriptional regulator n=1 Tax=Streptomyces sp. 796.1 TaxID=3163029 RepID=UPI0039C90E37